MNVVIGLALIMVECDYYFLFVRVDMRGVLMSRLKRVIKGMTDIMLEHLCKRRVENAAGLSAFIVGGFVNMYLEWHYHPGAVTLEQAAEYAGRVVELCVNNVGGMLDDGRASIE